MIASRLLLALSKLVLGALLSFTAAAAPPGPFAAGDAKADGYRVEAMATLGAPVPALPTEIPSPFARLLDPKGCRFLAADGTLLGELWARAELPLLPKPSPELGVSQRRIPSGAFVGVLRASGKTHDFRDQAIEAGIYLLRYVHQPSDGNHLGTSDSRDFLVLTSLAHDLDPAPVLKPEALIPLAQPVSPSDHALVLYVCEPEGEANADGSPRLFQRSGREEWAIDLGLREAVEKGKDESRKPETIRVGVVLVGHTAG